jgi:uncharacterized DUF497 family protein
MTQFEYDARKSRSNEELHGIDFDAAQEIWETTHVVIPAKSIKGENRFLILGRLRRKIYAAIFTQRGEVIRIISCHRADRRFEKIYERFIQKDA